MLSSSSTGYADTDVLAGHEQQQQQQQHKQAWALLDA
jgi:hypothetical protein